MPKTLHAKFTTTMINRALSNRTEPVTYRDTEVPGLVLRVGPRSASYYLEYKPTGFREDGRQFPTKKIKIGTTDSHSPSEARSAAARLKVVVSDGGDPAADKKAEKRARAIEDARATTMRDAVEAYITSSVSGSRRHITTESGALRNGLKEMQAEGMPPADVTVQDVLRMLDKNKGRACAVHRLGAMSRFFDDLVLREVVSSNPCKKIPKRLRPSPPASRTRVYTAEEVRSLWNTNGLSDLQLRFLRTLILLPLRFNELCELRCNEVHLAKSKLVLPGKKTKNGDAFAMPLPKMAADLLDVSVDTEDPRVFPMAAVGKEFTSWTSFKNKVRKGSGVADFRFHDLRRTFMTVLADQGIGDPSVADALLNHRQSATKAGVIAAYNQAALWPQKVRLMDAWAALLANALGQGEWTSEACVVPLWVSEQR